MIFSLIQNEEKGQTEDNAGDDLSDTYSQHKVRDSTLDAVNKLQNPRHDESVRDHVREGDQHLQEGRTRFPCGNSDEESEDRTQKGSCSAEDHVERHATRNEVRNHATESKSGDSGRGKERKHRQRLRDPYLNLVRGKAESRGH